MLSERDEVAQFFDEEAKKMFTNEVPRGAVCAFVAGTESEVDQLEVTVMSILEFLPGVRVAIAAEDGSVDAYQRCVSGSSDREIVAGQAAQLSWLHWRSS